MAVCAAVEKETGKKPGIKWVNDLFLDGKKVCGILTEAQSDLESGTIDRLITGIGVNCYPGSFSPEVSDVAGSLAGDTSEFSREILAASMINEILPLITTDMTDAEILGYLVSYAPMLNDLKIVSQRIPMDGTYSFAMIENKSVITMTSGQLNKNRKLLKDTIS